MQPSVFLATISLITASAVGNEMNITFECSKELKCGTTQTSMSTEQVLTPKCGEDVTLTCSISKHVKVVAYYWTNGTTKLCDSNRTTEEVSPHVHCEYKDQGLKLTIKDVKPIYSGKYFCFLLASSGHRLDTTELRVSDCYINRIVPRSMQNAGHDCASDSKCINLLVAFTLLTFVLVSGA